MWWRVLLTAALLLWLFVTGAAYAQDIRAIGVGDVRYVPLNCRTIRQVMTAEFRAQLAREERPGADATNLVVKMAREIAAACSR